MALRSPLQRKVIFAAKVEHGYEDQKAGRKLGAQSEVPCSGEVPASSRRARI